MPIDYSKWDNLEISDSDNDDDDNYDDGVNNDRSSMTPRVTRLDAPMKVTFGGNNNSSSTPTAHIEPSLSIPTATQDQAKSTTTSISTKSNNNNNNNNSIEFVKTTRTTSSPSSSSQASSWTERGGLVVVTTTAAGNGDDDDQPKQQGRKLYWSQDRYSVTFRLELKEVEGKVQSVDVAGILPYSDRFSAVGSTKPTLRCKGKTKNKNDDDSLLMLLEGELPHPVHLAEDDEDGVVDWSVVVREEEDNSSSINSRSCRFLMITLYKAVPMHGLSVWWRRPLMEFPELDLDQVKDTKTTQTTSGAATASQEFRKTWEEAHKIFREEKKKKNAILK